MAGGREDIAPGSKRKRLAADVEEDNEGADVSVKRAKAGDDADTTSGQGDGSEGRKNKGGKSADDDKGTSKSGLTIRWKMGSNSSGQKGEAADSGKPNKTAADEDEAPTEDDASELRSSRSQRHKKHVDSEPRKSALKKAKQAADDQDQAEEEAEDTPPVLGPDGEPLEVGPGKGKQVHEGPAVVQQKVQAPHDSVEALAAGVGATVENLSEGQRPVPPPGARPGSIAELGQPGQAGGKPEPPGQRLTREVYRVPAHAGWFRWEHIHELERRGVPEFFNGRAPSKTAKTYKEYRDFMISKYREEPHKYLTFTDVRKMLVGDVNALRRTFEFLDHWGLINYQAADHPRQRPPVWEGVCATLVQTAPSGIRVVAPAIAPQNALFKFDAPRAKPSSLATRPSVFPAASASVSASIAGEGAPPVPAVEYHCDRCGAACSNRRYHCQKQADFDLCPDCFGDGKFGAGMTTGDFIRMDASDAAVDADGGWTDQETLLLLEGLELFGDNWQEIAEHVGTKSRAQCILQFIQMPIEDPFLEELEASSTVTTVTDDPLARGKAAEKGGAQNGTEAQGPMTASQLIMQASGGGEGEPLTPFADAGNPVMAQVAFLAAMVGPRVAAAAAQAALAALTQEDPTAQTGPTTDPPALVPAPAPTAAPTALATPAATETPSSKPIADQGNGKAAAPEEPTDMVGDGAAEAPAAGEGEKAPATKAASEGAAVEPRQEGASEKGPDAKPASAKAEGVVETAEAEGGEAKAEAMQVDAKETAPAATPAPVAAALPVAATPLPSAAPPQTTPAPGPPSATQVRAAAATALAAAAVKAKLLADQEEREVARLVGLVVEAQLKKLEIKLKHFDELEEMLEREKDQIERARQQVYAERVRLAASRLAPTTPKTPAAPTGAQAAAGPSSSLPGTGNAPSTLTGPGLNPVSRANPVPASSPFASH